MNHYGNVCEVFNRRKAKIIDNDYQDLTSLYILRAELPVCESFGFYNEVMTMTSGRIVPHVEFNSWKIIEEDPFFVPRTQEEIEEWGDAFLNKNYTKELIDKVRTRKGLILDKKIVVEADK